MSNRGFNIFPTVTYLSLVPGYLFHESDLLCLVLIYTLFGLSNFHFGVEVLSSFPWNLPSKMLRHSLAQERWVTVISTLSLNYVPLSVWSISCQLADMWEWGSIPRSAMISCLVHRIKEERLLTYAVLPCSLLHSSRICTFPMPSNPFSRFQSQSLFHIDVQASTPFN